VEVVVQDTGIGIPKTFLPMIFDMFSQIDRTIERTAGGLGIGLALVKGLAEMHGGSVRAESEGEGKGASFTVSLPIAGWEPRPVVADPHSAINHENKRRILVVDNNRDAAASLATMLQLLGHEVATAYDGLEAIEVAEEFLPYAILMDVGMPRLNGYESTRRIRRQSWGQDMLIIALTGWGQAADRVKSREAGCDGHLVKPVASEEIERMLDELAKAR